MKITIKGFVSVFSEAKEVDGKNGKVKVKQFTAIRPELRNEFEETIRKKQEYVFTAFEEKIDWVNGLIGQTVEMDLFFSCKTDEKEGIKRAFFDLSLLDIREYIKKAE